jgi:pimeloyl-ACP methyl ester carboxylesterase
VRLILLPSPLLGPSVWAPVAETLRGQGYDVSVPGLPDRIENPADVLDAFVAGTPDEPCVLVPHSNAGLYAAALAAERPVEGLVFVDARLPEGHATATAEPTFRAYLEGLVDPNGLLPPWTRWWPNADVGVLFPDASTRGQVEAEQRRLPLSYFDRDVPAPPGWEALPAAYLAFGETYTEERALARERGWPVETLAGEHLHQLVDPVAVADSVVRLLRQAGVLPMEN